MRKNLSVMHLLPESNQSPSKSTTSTSTSETATIQTEQAQSDHLNAHQPHQPHQLKQTYESIVQAQLQDEQLAKGFIGMSNMAAKQIEITTEH